MQSRSRLAALAPVAIGGMRPWHPLKPCAPRAKYAAVLAEQPMPLSLAIMRGGVAVSHSACVIAAVTESCPHPAHSVDMPPS